jgi:hypothetical protein
LDGAPRDFEGSLSFDGKHFARIHAYVRPWLVGTQAQGIQLFESDGEEAGDLTYPHYYRVEDFTWSTDPRTLYFCANDALDPIPNHGGFWKMNVVTGDTSRPHFPWLPPGDRFYPPSVAPKGESYLVVAPNPASQTGFPGRIYRVWFRSGQRKLLTIGDGPTWSPDGSQIAFERAAPPSTKIRNQTWLMRADGTGVHPAPLPTQRQLREQLVKAHAASIETDALTWLGRRGRMVVSCTLSNDDDSQLKTGLWVVDPSQNHAEWVPDTSMITLSGDYKRAYMVHERPHKNAEVYLLTFTM